MSILKVRDKDGKFVDVPVISGRPASIKVGEVKLLEPNSEPTIENVGTEYDAIFNFGIPKGEYIVQGENFKLDLSDYAKQKQLDKEILNRQQTDNKLQSQIKSLASGSPLVANSMEEMIDTNRVYVNTTDGKWYYYNGTTWVSGGTYQASEDSETLSNIDNRVNSIFSEYNINWILGGSDNSNGNYTIGANNQIVNEELIPVKKGDILKISTDVTGMFTKIMKFDITGTYENFENWKTLNEDKVIDWDGYLRLVIRKEWDVVTTDNVNILTSYLKLLKYIDVTEDTKYNKNLTFKKINIVDGIESSASDTGSTEYIKTYEGDVFRNISDKIMRVKMVTYDNLKSYLKESKWIILEPNEVINIKEDGYKRFAVQDFVAISVNEEVLQTYNESFIYQQNIKGKLIQNDYLTWIPGNVESGCDNPNSLTVSSSSEFIRVATGDVISDLSKKYLVKIIKYDENKKYLSDISWYDLSNSSRVIDFDGYIRIAVRTSNWDVVNDEYIKDVSNNLVIERYSLNKLDDENKSLRDSWLSRVNEIQKSQGKKLCFGVQTDTHFWNKLYTKDYIIQLKELTNVMGFDFCINLGDIINGTTETPTTEMQNDLIEIVKRYNENAGCPMLFTVGNHDNNVLYVSANNGGLNDCILGDELYAKIIKPITARTDIVQNGNSMYYYKDFNDVRVIVLDSRDLPYQEISSTDIDNNNHMISDEQLNWFKDVALNTDKHVLVMCHIPLVTDLVSDKRVPSNSENILSELQTFKNNGGNIIGCMYGHTHSQNGVVVDGINHITFTNGGYFAEIVTVDVENKKINTFMVGDYILRNLIDREFNY